MKKSSLLTAVSLLLTILLSGCGGDSVSTVPSVNTPTPVIVATPTAIVTQVMSTLTEIEAKRVTISAKDGGKVMEGNMTVEIPGNSLETDTSVEIARVNIKEVTASNRNGVMEQYKISTGKEDVSYELQEPSTVRVKAGNNNMPLIWSGVEWLPVDYTYDGNTGEIIMGLNCLDEDINEWTDEGGEMGAIEAPLVVGIGTSTDYQFELVSNEGKGNFKIFYCYLQDKSYAESIGKLLEDAYKYYDDLKYNKPVKAMLDSGKESTYIYSYIYPSPSEPNFKKSYYGMAYPYGAMAFNKAILDVNKPYGQSTCYHELLHLIQFGHIGRDMYPNWFDESMAVSVQYYAITRPLEMYDVSGDEHWKPAIFKDKFNNSDDDFYEKYPFWSYIIKKEKALSLNDIMKEFNIKPYNIEQLNNVFQTKFKKNLVTYYNEFIEDYYMGGTFFNKTYFSQLKDRPDSQPYGSFIETNKKDPNDSSRNFSINPLSVEYICYGSNSVKGKLELELSEQSNCKVLFFYLKNNNGTYTVTREEAGNSKTIDNFGTGITELFILIENTSINSKATVTVKTSTP